MRQENFISTELIPEAKGGELVMSAQQEVTSPSGRNAGHDQIL